MTGPIEHDLSKYLQYDVPIINLSNDWKISTGDFGYLWKWGNYHHISTY